ncbi:Uncharacterised protein [Streptococcus pyogenes]|nr:Uncharacterised protein [Streptococcus pyogenes]VED99135.1 Uncharacterised protein [Streptococcus pyogenes]VGQ46651.1 Uncharacterised protein [Streptococcus pyogenes]VGQ80974.1 Uncharacterised protein [Streptococcus pyogenes]VGS11176.1 Uncharacterised protein [Streptococcus pyogenes]
MVFDNTKHKVTNMLRAIEDSQEIEKVPISINNFKRIK